MKKFITIVFVLLILSILGSLFFEGNAIVFNYSDTYYAINIFDTLIIITSIIFIFSLMVYLISKFRRKYSS